MLLIVTSTGDGLLRFINIDDLARPWASKIEVLANFSQFLAAVHILRMNCNEIARDTPGQPHRF